MCEIYWETANTVSTSPYFCAKQRSVPNFEKGDHKKNECLGERKEFLPQTFAWGEELTEFLVKKDCKIKYGFENPISNFDLGLFQLPNNQLMFSSLKCWNYLGL